MLGRFVIKRSKDQTHLRLQSALQENFEWVRA